MSLPRLVMFVEGKGDVQAVPRLAKRLIHDQRGFEVLLLDPEPYRVGSLGSLVKDNCKNWRRFLGAAAKKQPFAGVLLVLDGDMDRVPPTWKEYTNLFGNTFCPYHTAALLGHIAKEHGAGATFSVAVLFAMKEFESWIIAGIEGVRGVELSGGRGPISNTLTPPKAANIDDVRDAKGLLRLQIPQYKESLDQAILAGKLDLLRAAERSRSFRRMQSAVQRLVNAVRDHNVEVSPQMPA